MIKLELVWMFALLLITVIALMVMGVREYAKTHRIEPVDDVESGSIDQPLPGYSQPPPDYQDLPPPIYSEKPPSYESVYEQKKPFSVVV